MGLLKLLTTLLPGLFPDSIPAKYNYLVTKPVPNIVKEALLLYDIKEGKGTVNNKTILDWAKELNLSSTYSQDSIPWCGLFIALIVNRAGHGVITDPLWARNWLNFGKKVNVAMLGDILVFRRGSGGHVGVYVGEDRYYYHVLGGNQADRVSITRIEKGRCLGIRQPNWKVAMPDSVKQIFLRPDGTISKNEG